MLRKPGLVTSTLVLLAVLVLGVGVAFRAHPLMEPKSPKSPTRVGVGGVDLLVLFDPDGRAEASTFQAILNGADVTPQLEVASNGAHGSLHALMDGENHLELRIFGRGLPPFGGLWLEEVRDLRIDYRPPVDWDRG